MQFDQLPWWRTDAYEDDSARGLLEFLPDTLIGPHGPALVKLWADGRTGPGWGRREFMEAYGKKQFEPSRILAGYEKQHWNYAWVMRSVSLICIDIDGKNGGLEHASELGFLPPTVAETSKSGSGYHLFYDTKDIWDEADGFTRFVDQIGVVQGVDIRGVGCVYHYPQQRWNARNLAPIPEALATMLLQRKQRREASINNIKKTLMLDPEEVLIMQDSLIEELNKPIPEGKRNNSLFAIGQKMKVAEIENWSELILNRASELDLDDEEADKLVANIERYNA